MVIIIMRRFWEEKDFRCQLGEEMCKEEKLGKKETKRHEERY